MGTLTILLLVCIVTLFCLLRTSTTKIQIRNSLFGSRQMIKIGSTTLFGSNASPYSWKRK